MAEIREKEHPVAKRTAAVEAAEACRKLPRTMRKGQQGMWDARQEYLPALEGESTTNAWEYPARLKRSTFYPFINEAVGFAVGQVFSHEPKLGEDVSKDLRAWCEDIDRRGNNLHVFGMRVFEDFWWTGCGLFLVDMPPLPRGEDGRPVPMSRGEADSAGSRPFLVRYDVEDVLGWRYEVVAGRRRLKQVRLHEATMVDDGEYGEREERRIRVFWAAPLDAAGKPIGLARFAAWTLERNERSGEHEWVETTKPTELQGMTEIPLVVVGDLDGKPPLEDLAYLNLAHWQMHSDLQHIEHVANVPVPYAIGAGETIGADGKPVALKWGPNSLLNLPAGASPPGYVEHSGKCIGELKKSLDKLEAEMGRRAMRSILEQRTTGTVTATSDIITAGRTFSVLEAAALRLQDALELGFGYMVQYAGLGVSGGSVELNRQFIALPRDAQALEFVKWLVAAGVLSRQTAFTIGVRLEIVPDSTTYEDEQRLIAEEGAPLGSVGSESRMAKRVVELVKGGASPDDALAQASAEAEGPSEDDDEDGEEAA